MIFNNNVNWVGPENIRTKERINLYLMYKILQGKYEHCYNTTELKFVDISKIIIF